MCPIFEYKPFALPVRENKGKRQMREDFVVPTRLISSILNALLSVQLAGSIMTATKDFTFESIRHSLESEKVLLETFGKSKAN